MLEDNNEQAEIDNYWEDNQELNDHDYLFNPSQLTEYTRHVIKYIGGFIVHKLNKILKCNLCLN